MKRRVESTPTGLTSGASLRCWFLASLLLLLLTGFITDASAAARSSGPNTPQTAVHVVLSPVTQKRVKLWSQAAGQGASPVHRELDCTSQRVRDRKQRRAPWQAVKPGSSLWKMGSYLCHKRFGLWQTAHSREQLSDQNKPTWVRGQSMWYVRPTHPALSSAGF